MLSGILKKEECAACRFCCSFRKTSLWETPIFTKENIDAIKANPNLDSDVLIESEIEGLINATYDLSNNYKTDDPNEEAPCPYLSETGCILSSEEKPWDCKIWPLRVMKLSGGEIVIALTPTCPEINKIDTEEVRNFVNESLRDDLFEYAEKHPYLIKEYKEGFPILERQKLK